MGFKLPSAGVTPAPSDKKKMRDFVPVRKLVGGNGDARACAEPESERLSSTFRASHWVQGSALPKEVWNPPRVPHSIKENGARLRAPLYLTLRVLARSSPAGRMRSPMRTESALR